MLVKVFRYGKVTMGRDWIRLQNRLNDTTIHLTASEAARWRKFLTSCGAREVNDD